MYPRVAIQIQQHIDCYNMLKLAADTGFHYVSMGFGSADIFQRDDWKDEIKNIKKALSDYGLECVMTHAPYYSLLISAEITDPVMEKAIMNCVDATAMLGAEIIAIHPRAFLRNEIEDVEQSYHYNMINLKAPVEESEKVGCLLGIENLPTYPNWAITFFSNFPDWHRRLVEDLNSPAVCAVWDFGHSHLSHENPPEAILEVGSIIRGTHVHDNNRVIDDHFIPFKGSVDWNANIKALKQTGYSGYLTLEVNYEEESVISNPRKLREYFKESYENVVKLDNIFKSL